jgi:hypothetical protein
MDPGQRAKPSTDSPFDGLGQEYRLHRAGSARESNTDGQSREDVRAV